MSDEPTPYARLRARHELIRRELEAAVVAAKDALEAERVRFEAAAYQIQRACQHPRIQYGYHMDSCPDCGFWQH